MKAANQWLGRAGLAALAAVTAAVVVLGHGRHGNSPSASPTKPPLPTTAALPWVKPINEQAAGGLETRIAGFLQAYYRILPGDTAAVRRRRISPFISPALAGKLKFGAAKTDQPFVQSRVVTEEMVIVNPHGPKEAIARVPVRIYVRRSSDSSERYITLDTLSAWRKISGRWVVTSFN